MRVRPIWALLGVALVLGTSCVETSAKGDKKTAKTRKVCFVAGKDSHARGAHEHCAGLQYFLDEFAKYMPNIKTSIHKGGWPEDPSFFDGADAVVIYCDGGKRHVVMKNLKQLDKLAKAGVGIGCIHYGVEVPKGEAGDYFLEWIGGYFEAGWSVNPHWVADFKEIPKHPVTSGVKPFKLLDEWYFHMRFPEQMKGVTATLSAVPPLDTIKRPDGPHSGNPTVRKEVKAGLKQHVAWVVERPDGSRGFGTTGGHFHKSWQEDNFRTLVLNSIVWIAGGEVPKGGVASPHPTDEELEAYLPPVKKK